MGTAAMVKSTLFVELSVHPPYVLANNLESIPVLALRLTLNSVLKYLFLIRLYHLSLRYLNLPFS